MRPTPRTDPLESTTLELKHRAQVEVAAAGSCPVEVSVARLEQGAGGVGPIGAGEGVDHRERAVEGHLENRAQVEVAAAVSRAIQVSIGCLNQGGRGVRAVAAKESVQDVMTRKRCAWYPKNGSGKAATIIGRPVPLPIVCPKD